MLSYWALGLAVDLLEWREKHLSVIAKVAGRIK